MASAAIPCKFAASMCRILAFSFFALLALASAEPPARPNILFLFTDDQHVDPVGAFGNPHIRTPHIDRLVGEDFWSAYEAAKRP